MNFSLNGLFPAPIPVNPGEPGGGPEITNPSLSDKIRYLSGLNFLNRFLPNLISILFVIAIIIALIVLIIGGIKWMTSGDNKEAAAKAQGTITAAIIGLILVFSVYGILNLIGYFFGIDLIHIDIEPLILK